MEKRRQDSAVVLGSFFTAGSSAWRHMHHVCLSLAHSPPTPISHPDGLFLMFFLLFGSSSSVHWSSFYSSTPPPIFPAPHQQLNSSHRLVIFFLILPIIVNGNVAACWECCGGRGRDLQTRPELFLEPLSPQQRHMMMMVLMVLMMMMTGSIWRVKTHFKTFPLGKKRQKNLSGGRGQRSWSYKNQESVSEKEIGFYRLIEDKNAPSHINSLEDSK